jgi:hypothetical protein
VTARRWAVRGVGQEGYARRVRSRDTAGADRGFLDRPGAMDRRKRRGVVHVEWRCWDGVEIGACWQDQNSHRPAPSAPGRRFLGSVASQIERGPALSRGRVDSARPQRDREEPEAPCAGVQGRVREVRAWRSG